MVGVAALLLLALTPTSQAQDPATADISVTLTVCEGTVYQSVNNDCATVDAAAGLTVNDKITLYYVVANAGPDPATVTFHPEYPDTSGTGNRYYEPFEWRWGQYSGWNAGDQAVLWPGQSLWYREGGIANAPGTLVATQFLDSTALDPDASNNTGSWQTSVHCRITGTEADDTLVGTEFGDSVCGGGGDDHLTAAGDQVKLFGQAGDDRFDGTGDYREGLAIGGAGQDTASYANADHGVIFCRFFDNGINYTVVPSGWAPNRLVDIERFIGSRYGDFMEGSAQSDRLLGRGGNDVLIGLSGSDVFVGGEGRDRFRSRDQRRDVLRGGPGIDRARVDAKDVLKSTKAVSTLATPGYCDG